jgi:serine/threonine-protein kinase
LSNLDESTRRDERVSEIIAGYLDAREAGTVESPEELLARHPEFEKELSDFLGNEDFVSGIFSASDLPPHFGDDFDVLEEIGRGGMGVVYKCHQKSLDKVVAIKTIIGSLFVTPEDIERVRKEAQKAAGLRHPNIVTVHHVAQHNGQYFFVMDYIEGKSLADLISERRLSSDEAVQCLKTIADAIHYAHQRQILHCDLKPANILIDNEGKLYVTDFGLAKRLGEDGNYVPRSVGGGTATYMAPEQVMGDELTTATDIYGLGGILYALLTGSSPFRGESLQQTLRRVREESPMPPRVRNPEVDKDLEAVCLICLKKNKDERYGSAYGLVRDLERYQNGEETAARRWTRREHFVGWCRRNPGLAGLLASIAVISMLTIVMAISIAHRREQSQLEQARESNNYAARDLAKTALLQLRDWSHVVELAAANGRLSQLVERKDDKGLQRYIEQVCDDASDFCASSAFRNAAGFIVARAGGGNWDPNIKKIDFSGRDYFQGAMAHQSLAGRNSVHISKVYHSVLDGLYKFGVSAPVVSQDGKFVGQLDISVTTNAALGLVRFEDVHRKAALIAPRDSGGPETKREDPLVKHVILFHPAYHRGDRPIPFPEQSAIARHGDAIHAKELDDSALTFPPVDDYRDPVGSYSKDYQGRWIAGFAPIGNTGFFVIVQQRFDDALRVDPFVSWNLAVGIALTFCFLIAIVFVLMHRKGRHSALFPS